MTSHTTKRGALALLLGVAAATLLVGLAGAQTPTPAPAPAATPPAPGAAAAPGAGPKGTVAKASSTKSSPAKTAKKKPAHKKAKRKSQHPGVRPLSAKTPASKAAPSSLVPPLNLGGATPVTPAAPATTKAPAPIPAGAPVVSSSPFSSPPSQSGTIAMDFRGADVNNVLRFFATATGWQIVPDASLTGPVTIISPQSLSIDQAFMVLQSTLSVRGYTGQFEKHGSTTILKIVPFQSAVGSTTQMGDGQLTPDELKGQVVTQVIQIQNTDASTMARDLLPLVSKGASIVGSVGTNALVVTDTASNVARIAGLVKLLDQSGSVNKIEIFQLKHADATTMESMVNNIFRQVNVRTRANAQTAQPGQPQPQPQITPQGGAIVAVADTRSNSLLVVASEDNMARVRELITKLDSTDVSAMTTKIVPMKYASAVDVADLVNAVLSGTIPTGSSNNQGGGGFFSRVFGTGNTGVRSQSVSSTDAFAKVVADQRTNSVVVTATEDKMAKVEALISQLDVKVPMETTTFVVPLKKAQATTLAQILSSAFGTSSGSGSAYNPFGGYYGGSSSSNRNSSSSSTQRINRNTSTRAYPVPNSRAQALPTGLAPTAIPADGVPGTMTPSGFVPDPQAPQDTSQSTDPASRQFYFGGYGGGGGMQQQTPIYGRGSSGGYANLLQFRNNVGVVAENASNSLIITTTPDNMTALKEIIEKLDAIPQQVMIEVIIAEASLDSTQKLGVQFDAKGIGAILGDGITQSGSSNFSLTGGATTAASIASGLTPGIQYGIQALSGKFNALVQALQTDTRVRILSTPKVFTSNNAEAEIDVTTNVPYVTSTYNGGTSFGSSSNYDFLKLGITLNVTPRITSDGHVTMDVLGDASDLVGFDSITSSVDTNGTPTVIQAPRTSERHIDTQVSVKDGDVVVLGGLMQDNKTISANKVPILGDLPFIGTLFRSTTTTTSKTELMIFLIPHVVDTDKSIRTLAQDQATNLRHSMPDLQREHPILKPDAGPAVVPAPAPGATDAPAYKKQ